jgi:MFS family permease
MGSVHIKRPKAATLLNRVQGFPLSFGVFQNYYSQLPQFKDSPYIAVVGTVASGMSYLAAPIVIPLIRRYSKYRYLMIWIGCKCFRCNHHPVARILIAIAGPICLLGLVAGSFARSLATLIFTQGVMYGTGFILFYYPILSMVNEFWITRRGMAYGVLCSASGVSGAAMPFVIEKLLEKYGYPTTLRAIAVGLFVVTGPLIPFLKGRLPESETSSTGRTDWSFFKVPLFWIYSVSNLAMGMGYFFPSLYIPSYASANGMSSTQGAILLAAMSVSQVLGQSSFGYLSDRRMSLNVLAIASTAIAATAVYAAWGLAHSFKLLIVFSLIYGFFGAGYTALWGRMGTAISSEPTAAFTAFGLLNFGKGVGNVLAGPISAGLLKDAVNVHRYGAVRYETVVLFTGSCMLVSAAVIPFCYIRKMRSIL